MKMEIRELEKILETYLERERGGGGKEELEVGGRGGVAATALA